MLLDSRSTFSIFATFFWGKESETKRRGPNWIVSLNARKKEGQKATSPNHLILSPGSPAAKLVWIC